MKTFIFSFVVLCLSFYSCGHDDNKTQTTTTKENNSPQQTPASEQTQKENSTPETQKAPERKVATNNNADGIRVKFPKGATQVSMNGKINGLGDNITYVFEVSKGQKLNASVKPQNGSGNIRINQIISPSGNADGPFSNQMTYSLSESGDWQLVVGESNMEGEPYIGEYVLTIGII